MSISPVDVFHIPTPASGEHVRLYTEIRLSSLLTNPEAFGSTYARESAFPREEWRNRLNTQGRTTLLASLPSSSTGLAPNTPLGTLTILSPTMLSDIPQDVAYPPEVADAERRGTAEVWVIVGMWVRPQARGRGVGRMLVDKAVEVVRAALAEDEVGQTLNADMPVAEIDKLVDVWGGVNEEPPEDESAAFVDVAGGKKDRIILLRVHEHNIPAQRLYASAGFEKEVELDAELAGELESVLGVQVPDERKSKGLCWMMFTVES